MPTYGTRMEIAILDDYQDAVRGLRCFRRLEGHGVRVYNDTVRDPAALAKRLRGVEALVLIRERTPIGEELLRLLPELRLVSQTGRLSGHIDVEACTRHGVVVAEGRGSPVAPAELTWALVLAAMRHVAIE